MKKKIAIALIALASLAGCGEQDTGTRNTGDGSQEKDTAAVCIAVMPTLDCLPLFLASDHGLFANAGLDVSLLPLQAQMDCDTALLSGSADGMVTDVVRAERLQHQGVSLDYLTATQASWQLLTGKTARISRLNQLNDKMMAMTRYSATDLLGDMAVDSAGLNPETVFRIQVNDVTVRLNMLQNNIMDALWLPEPQATAARNLQARVLIDTRQLNLCFGIIAFRQHSLTDAQKQTFTNVYNQACDSLNQLGLAAFSDLIISHCHVSQQVVDSLPSDIRFDHATAPRQSDLEKVGKWLEKGGSNK